MISKAQYRGISKCKHRGYLEIHHIIPRCIGGKDVESNIMLLTYSEHCMAHYLLTKIFDYAYLTGAYIMMKNDIVRLNKKGYINESICIESNKVDVFLESIKDIKILIV